MSPSPILVVDDNTDNLDLTGILLESEGFEVWRAEDAGQALGFLRTRRPPALILMDLQLPGMDGLALTRRLRQDRVWDEVPIIALTAYAMNGDEEKARAAGCSGYITKPIDTRTFAREVKRHLSAAKR